MPITLIPLPYSRDALAPTISAETLEFHHGKHHATYVEKTNAAAKTLGSENDSLEEIIAAAKQANDKPAFNNAAQSWNHGFYWHSLSPEGGEPNGALAEAIDRDFGSLDAGSGHTPEAQARAPYRVLSYAFLTPEKVGATHYFWFQLRNVAVDDAAVTAEFEALYRATFDEDKALLEAIQRTEDRDPGLTPVRIASDAGVVRLRRIVERRLAAEASSIEAPSRG